MLVEPRQRHKNKTPLAHEDVHISGPVYAQRQETSTAVEKKREDYAFWHKCNEKPSIIPGCPSTAVLVLRREIVQQRGSGCTS